MILDGGILELNIDGGNSEFVMDSTGSSRLTMRDNGFGVPTVTGSSTLFLGNNSVLQLEDNTPAGILPQAVVEADARLDGVAVRMADGNGVVA